MGIRNPPLPLGMQNLHLWVFDTRQKGKPDQLLNMGKGTHIHSQSDRTGNHTLPSSNVLSHRRRVTRPFSPLQSITVPFKFAKEKQIHMDSQVTSTIKRKIQTIFHL